MDLRIFVYYGSLIDSWVPGVVLLTFYTLFGFERMAVLAGHRQYWIPVHTPTGKLPMAASAVRLLPVARINQAVGGGPPARAAGCPDRYDWCVFNLGLYITYAVMSALHVQWRVMNGFITHYLSSVFCAFPLTLSLRLAWNMLGKWSTFGPPTGRRDPLGPESGAAAGTAGNSWPGKTNSSNSR